MIVIITIESNACFRLSEVYDRIEIESLAEEGQRSNHGKNRVENALFQINFLY